MAVLFYLSSISNLKAVADPQQDELLRTVAHFLFYTAGYGLFFRAFLSKKANYILPLLLVLLYALFDEIHQHFVPVRTFQLQDLLVDGLGACLGLIILQEQRLVKLIGRLG